jgi:hypothetical protein
MIPAAPPRVGDAGPSRLGDRIVRGPAVLMLIAAGVPLRRHRRSTIAGEPRPHRRPGLIDS